MEKAAGTAVKALGAKSIVVGLTKLIKGSLFDSAIVAIAVVQWVVHETPFVSSANIYVTVKVAVAPSTTDVGAPVGTCQVFAAQSVEKEIEREVERV